MAPIFPLLAPGALSWFSEASSWSNSVITLVPILVAVYVYPTGAEASDVRSN